MILIATIAGLMSALFWGLGDYYAARTSKNHNEYFATFIIQTIGLLPILPFIFVYGLNVDTPISLLIAGLSALFFTTAYISYLKAFSVGNVGIVAPVANSYAIVTLLIGITFLGAQLTSAQIGFVVIIVAGIITVSMKKNAESVPLYKNKSLLWALLTAVLWGVAFVFVDIIIDSYRWFELFFLTFFGVILFSGIFAMIKRKKEKIIKQTKTLFITKANKFAPWMAGLLLGGGSIAFYLGIESTGSVVIPVVIASTSPLVTSIAARFVDKEKLTVIQRF